MFTHQGRTYLVDELLIAVKGMKPVHFPVSKLIWMVGPEGTYEAERVAKVDLKYPVIVHEYTPGNFATLDGFHRVVRAVQNGQQTIPAIVVDDALIRKLTRQTVSEEDYYTRAEAFAASAHHKTAKLALNSEARQKAIECDEMGINPKWPLTERIARLQEILNGDELSFDEAQRKAAYAERPWGAVFRTHYETEPEVVHGSPFILSEEGYFTKDEAYAAAARECDAKGVDPTLPLPERVARLQDIYQGSPLMAEERKRAADYFHKTLREKLGQASNEAYNDVTFKSVAVTDPDVAKLIAESETDRFLGDIVTARKTKTVTGFFKGGKVVGFAVPRKDTDGRYRTGAIFVSSQYQHQGIAGKFVEQYFTAKSGRAMIEPDNTKSQKLFASVGFKRSGKTIRDSEGGTYEVWLKD